MISYKPLWKTLIDKDMKKGDLMELTRISFGTLAKMGNDKYVSLEVIDRICRKLQVPVSEVIEYVEN